MDEPAGAFRAEMLDQRCEIPDADEGLGPAVLQSLPPLHLTIRLDLLPDRGDERILRQAALLADRVAPRDGNRPGGCSAKRTAVYSCSRNTCP